MKLFIREQLPLIIIYIIQLIVTPFIYWLDGFSNFATMIYVLLLNSILFIGYLAFRFLSLHSFYRRLSNPIDTLDEIMDESVQSPLAVELKQILERQYQLYYTQIQHYQKEQRDHITFINHWVHQMKTPVSVMNLTIQEKKDPIFDDIREELDRLQNGLGMVLYIARLKSFEKDFQIEPVNLKQMVKKVISEHKRLFIRHRVYPEIQVDEQIRVQSDEKWLHFILSQLITNAVRYSVGNREKVIVSSTFRGKRVLLEVKDSGIGIPKQDIRRVFEPYFTGQHGREYRESTGLGLHLVQEVCKQLNHQVELESEEGVGTTVRIIFREAVFSLITKM